MYVSRIASFQADAQQNLQNKKNGFLDNIHQYTLNKSDMTDTIVVPRTIFKGYLGIMTGTTLITLGIALAQKFSKTAKVLNVTGLLASLYGTWAFVRPFVMKDAKGVSKTK
ncbi:MAG: hypothetical protein LKG27_07580 [Clostridiaceae bacterium]|jgi:hypothetical protein|nr:hypothetical protein [Clostridiaceae bacterium]